MTPILTPTDSQIRPNERAVRRRSASQFTLIAFGAAILIGAALLYLSYRDNWAWQWVMMAGVVAGVIVLQGAGLLFIRRNNVVLGIGLMLAGWIIAGPLSSVVISGRGVIFGAALFLLVSFVAGQTLSARHSMIAVVIGLVAGAATLLIDLFGPDFRMPAANNWFVVPTVAAMLLVYTLFTVRRFSQYTLRTKLIIAFVGVAVFGAGTVSLIADQVLRNQLTASAGTSLTSLANSKANEVGQVLDRKVDQLRTISLNKFVQDVTEAASRVAPPSADRIQTLDQQWRAAANDNDPLVSGILNNDLSGELREFQRGFPEHAEVFITDSSGLLLAATNRTSDYYQADEEWWQVASRDGVYIGQPELDESSQTVGLIIAVAVPAHDRDDIIGVLRTTVTEDILIEPLSTGRFGKTGHVHINLPGGQELHLETEPEPGLHLAPARLNVDELLQAPLPYAEVMLTSGAQHYASQSEVALGADQPAADARAIANLHWQVVAHQERGEALQTVENSARVALLVTLAVLTVAGALALLVAQLLTRPITRLTAVAAQVSGGDLNVQAPVETNDEIGALATTFNVMTTQLRESLEGLEQRVAERTNALRTSVEVSRRISTAMDRSTLAKLVVEQLQSAFGYYHAHIYFFDAAQEYLVMAGGTGEAGRKLLERGHRLPKGRGLVGRAAERNQIVLVPDTLSDPQWLPNPLLPETRAEVAVPITVGEQVAGVLDVQHNAVNGLTAEDAELLQGLANQVAIALQNAQSFERAREQASLEAQVNAIGHKIQSATTVESALQIAARELGRALGGARTRVSVQPRVSTQPLVNAQPANGAGDHNSQGD